HDHDEHEHHHDHNEHVHHHDHDHDEHGHHHDHHGHHHADEIFDNIGVETPKHFDEAAIREALEELDDGNGAEYGRILRAKGILPTNDGRWLHFDYVPGEWEVREGTADYTGRLCVIGVGVHQDAVKELFGI
ncbi:MAG: cobalamin biosynthesis protein CobW, partial [Clostridia bacterium]|nr:cobalamin biosynthesis protein CobW [Clostridia bacterium]